MLSRFSVVIQSNLVYRGFIAQMHDLPPSSETAATTEHRLTSQLLLCKGAHSGILWRLLQYLKCMIIFLLVIFKKNTFPFSKLDIPRVDSYYCGFYSVAGKVSPNLLAPYLINEKMEEFCRLSKNLLFYLGSIHSFSCSPWIGDVKPKVADQAVQSKAYTFVHVSMSQVQRCQLCNENPPPSHPQMLLTEAPQNWLQNEEN